MDCGMGREEGGGFRMGNTCRERPGPDERAGGWLSGDTEAEIHEDSETDSKTARGDTHTHTRTHTHTHTLECGLWNYFCS